MALPHRLLRTVVAISALLLCISLPYVHAGEGDVESSDPLADTDPRVILIGNELLTASQTAYLLDGLLKSAEWMHEDTRASRLYTHLHDGYTLGPNPLASDFDAANYDFLTLPHFSTPPPPPDLHHPLSNIPRENLEPIVKEAGRTNEAALNAIKPVAGQKPGADFLAEATFRLLFPTKESVAPMAWLPYDNDTASSTYGFRGSSNSSIPAGIVVFDSTQESNVIDFANLPPAEDEVPMKAPVWKADETLKGDVTISVWVSLSASSLESASLAPVFDCRSEVSHAKDKALYVALAPHVVDGHAFMEFEFNSVSTAAAGATASEPLNKVSSYQLVQEAVKKLSPKPAGQALKDATAKETAAHAIVPDVWTHWVVTIAEKTGDITMYRDGVQVAKSGPAALVPIPGPQKVHISQFPLPAASRAKCGLGRSFAPPPATGAATSLSGKMMDFSVIPRVLPALEVASLYAARPTQISFLLPPLPVNFRAVRSTTQAHAFCANTLKLFNKKAHPLPWSHVVLQDHALGPFTPWWQRHSLLPGLSILTSAILAHSPQAKIYLVETWPHSAAVPGFNVSSLGERTVGGVCFGAQDGLTWEDMVKRSSEYFVRVYNALVDDQSNALAFNYTSSSSPLLTDENFKILPVASLAWAGRDASKKMWLDDPKQLYLDQTMPVKEVSARDHPLKVTDPVAAQAAAMPSAIGAFAFATAMFVELTKYNAACPAAGAAAAGASSDSCSGYCPCNLAPANLFPTSDAVESAEEKARRYKNRDEVCRQVRNGVTERMQVHSEKLSPMVISPLPVLDEHFLCNMPCPTLTGNDTRLPDGCISNPSSSSSTGPAFEAIYPDPDPEADEGAAAETKGHDLDPEEDGVEAPSLRQSTTLEGGGACAELPSSCSSDCVLPVPSLPPVPLVLIGVTVLSAIAFIIGCVYYRKKRVAWELVDSKGYDVADKEAFDQATSLEDDQL
jgi:hypothetical protein